MTTTNPKIVLVIESIIRGSNVHRSEFIHQDISYNNEEISGFFYCCTFDFDECDRGSNRNWKDLNQELVEFDSRNTIIINPKGL